MTKAKKSFNISKSGFTLIELVLYVSIVGAILIVMVGFLWNIVFGNIKEVAYQEVQQNGRFSMAKITQEVKKATGVNSPAIGSTSTVLSLTAANSKINPVIFDVDGGKLRITRGSLGSTYLTSDQTIINNIQFSNISYSQGPPTIRIEMTLDHVNPENQSQYQASISLKSTVVLLPGGAADPVPHLTQLRYRWKDDTGAE